MQPFRTFLLSSSQVGRKLSEVRAIKQRTLHGLTVCSGRAIGMVPSHHFRLFAYRKALGMKVGSHTTIYRKPELLRPSRICIGNNTVIGRGAILDGRCGISIGNNVNFSSGVWIWTLEHDKDDPAFGPQGSPVVVEDRAWLSCRSTILPGVTIGEGAIVCAGAVVTKDVAPFAIVAGVPAKKIAERRRDLTYDLTHRVPLL